MENYHLVGKLNIDSSFQGINQFSSSSSSSSLHANTDKNDKKDNYYCKSYEKMNAYIHQHANGMFVLSLTGIDGPLCHFDVIVPTEPADNAGTPHTLEHLIFVGSKNVPYRHYLDELATRSGISDGTNAWTEQDHTGYTLTTAGSDGLMNVVPVFLDYILHPTLTHSNFLMEVYHVDGSGKELGVVYSEMHARNNTESDLMDDKLRQLLFPTSSYKYNVGGLCSDIRHLSLDTIRNFHTKHYIPSNMFVLAAGCFEADDLLRAIATTVDFPTNLNSNNNNLVWNTPLPRLANSVMDEIVKFPSECEDVGSYTITWQGPTLTDSFTMVALDVLFRYLQETAASPLQKRFVAKGLASSVEYNIVYTPIIYFSISFSGVPFKSSKHDGNHSDKDDEDDEEDDEDEDEDDEDDDDEDDDEDDEEEDSDKKKNNLLEPGVFRKLLFEELEKIIHEIFDSTTKPSTEMCQTIRIHRVKFFESMEDHPANTIGSLVQPIMLFSNHPDILSSSFSSTNDSNSKNKAVWGDFSKDERLLRLLSNQLSVLSNFDIMENEPASFWGELLSKYFLSAPFVDILSIPDSKMAHDLLESEANELKQRCETLGEVGLKACNDARAFALEENERPIPEDILSKIPPMPDPKRIPTLPTHSEVKYLSKFNNVPVQLIRADGQFIHLGVYMNSDGLDNSLRPYLLLLQELLLQSDMDGAHGKRTYTECVQQMHNETVSITCGAGVGQGTFTADFLPEAFYIYGLVELDKLSNLCKWVFDVMFQTVFTESRIKSVVSNLLGDISEQRRDADSIITSVATMLTTNFPSSNEKAICFISQYEFLSRIGKSLPFSVVIENMKKVRAYLLSDPFRIFMVMCAPPTSSNDNGLSDDELLHSIEQSWSFNLSNSMPSSNNLKRGLKTSNNGQQQQQQQQQLNSNNNSGISKSKKKKIKQQNKKRKQNGSQSDDSNSSNSNSNANTKIINNKNFNNKNFNNKNNNDKPRLNWCIPYKAPINPFHYKEKGILVTVPGVDAIYLEQYVSTGELEKKSVDYFPIVVLCQMLSMMDGPLVSNIRGKGLSYDAGVYLQLQDRRLNFYLGDATSPHGAMAVFHQVLREFEENLMKGVYHLDTARAMSTYSSFAKRSYVSAAVHARFKGFLMGFESEQEENEYEAKSLSDVTKYDVQRVFLKYFTKFLNQNDNGDGRVTLVVTSPGVAATVVSGLAENGIIVKTKSLAEIIKSQKVE